MIRKSKKKWEPLKMSQYILGAVVIIALLILNYWYLKKYLSFNSVYITDYHMQEDLLAQYRDPAVAGIFYAGTQEELSKSVDSYVEAGQFGVHAMGRPQIIIVPHAGYVYSAETAGKAYALLQNYAKSIKNVIIVGPSHYYPGKEAYLSDVDFFRTPLGRVPVNKNLVHQLASANKEFKVNNKAHEKEHSVEVQLPFIQKILPRAQIVPIVYGDISPEELAKGLNKYISSKDTLLVISADLSHYYPYDKAKEIDEKTMHKIAKNEPIEDHESCGAIGINAALILAKNNSFYPQMLDLTNSGDVNDDKTRVVGYGSWSFYKNENFAKKQSKLEKEIKNLNDFADLYEEQLLNIARISLKQAIKDKKTYSPSRRSYPEDIFNRGASFVTLEKNGELRGCIGSVLPTISIAQDVSDNAYAAALSDKRFPPVSAEELPLIKLKISLLSNFYEIKYQNERDLLSKIKEQQDGVIIRDGNRQGVFLPSVWEQIPEKEEFFKQLKIKAGMNPNYWNNRIKVYRFRTVEINDEN